MCIITGWSPPSMAPLAIIGTRAYPIWPVTNKLVFRLSAYHYIRSYSTKQRDNFILLYNHIFERQSVGLSSSGLGPTIFLATCAELDPLGLSPTIFLLDPLGLSPTNFLAIGAGLDPLGLSPTTFLVNGCWTWPFTGLHTTFTPKLYMVVLRVIARFHNKKPEIREN